MPTPSVTTSVPLDLRLARQAAGRRIFRFIGTAVAMGTVVVGIAAILMSDRNLLAVAGLSAVAAAAPWRESRREQPDVFQVMVVWLLLLAAMVPFLQGYALVGLAVPLTAVAITAGLLVDQRRQTTTLSLAIFMTAGWQLWWLGREGGFDVTWLVTALMVIVGLSAGLVTVRLLRRQVFITQARYQDLFNSVPVGLFRTSLDGTILAANQRLAKILGFDRVVDLMKVKAPSLYVDPGARGRALQAFEAGQPAAIVRLRRHDGRVITVREAARVVRDPDGRVLGYEGSLEDITERVEAEESARRAQQVFGVAFEAAPIGMALVGLDGRPMRVNPAFRELVGATTPAGTFPDEVLEAIRSVSPPSPGEVVETEIALPRKSGGVRVAKMSVATIAEQEEGQPALVVQLADVSAQKELQDHLEGLVRAKNDFVASVSHELRTPLTAVVGLTREILDHGDSFSSEESRQLLELVAQQGADVAHIVEDLLVAARTEMGRLAVSSVPVDLTEEVNHAVTECEHLQVGRGARVSFGLEPAKALADPLRVRQIIRNLLANAFRYGGATVEVTAAQSGDLVRLQVRDDGPGLPPEEWEAVFRPYHRAHASPTVAGSIGLGLSVSKTLAVAMAGDLTYRYQDGVSIFELTLPAFS